MTLRRTHAAHSLVLVPLIAARWLDARRVPVVPWVLRAVSRVVFSADIPFGIDLSQDVVFMHNGLGTVIHPDAEFQGPAVVFQGVTIGRTLGPDDGCPVIGHNVVIGAGAKILGAVRVGLWAVVGANAVVTRDVPPGHIAVGNPATLKRARQDVLRRVFP